VGLANSRAVVLCRQTEWYDPILFQWRQKERYVCG